MVRAYGLWLPEFFVLVSLLATAGRAQTPTYIVTDLGTLPGYEFSRALGVNESGQVVGYSGRRVPQPKGLPYFEIAACLWSEGAVISLGRPNGQNSFAEAINRSGHIVVRTSSSPGVASSFLWADGSLTDIVSLSGRGTQAYDINDSDQIVGWSVYVPPVGFGSINAFIWANDDMTNIGDIGSQTSAFAINNLGQIVVARWLVDGEEWTSLGMRGLDINDQGQVVGHAGALIGFWEEGTLIVSERGIASAINNSGNVVGGLQEGSAFLWQGGKLYDLNALVHPASEFRLDNATDINDRGQIVGYGHSPSLYEDAFILTPIDADLNRDEDVDHQDHRLFVECLSGPGTAISPECSFADMDQSGLVDLVDFRSLQLSLTAP